MSKTRWALYFYFLAIGLLTACALVIVLKLIVFPPCTQQGNACVVDPWSAAGLEGTVLGVSATVLAILGAVAVAGWWTTLDRRVRDQVSVLYDAQKAEVSDQIDKLLAVEQKKVDIQLASFRTALDSMQQEVGRLRALSEQANEVIQQTSQRSEEQLSQLLKTDRRAAEVATRMQDLLVESQKRASQVEEASRSLADATKRWMTAEKKSAPKSDNSTEQS